MAKNKKKISDYMNEEELNNKQNFDMNKVNEDIKSIKSEIEEIEQQTIQDALNLDFEGIEKIKAQIAAYENIGKKDKDKDKNAHIEVLEDPNVLADKLKAERKKAKAEKRNAALKKLGKEEKEELSEEKKAKKAKKEAKKKKKEEKKNAAAAKYINRAKNLDEDLDALLSNDKSSKETKKKESSKKKSKNKPNISKQDAMMLGLDEVYREEDSFSLNDLYLRIRDIEENHKERLGENYELFKNISDVISDVIFSKEPIELPEDSVIKSVYDSLELFIHDVRLKSDEERNLLIDIAERMGVEDIKDRLMEANLNAISMNDGVLKDYDTSCGILDAIAMNSMAEALKMKMDNKEAIDKLVEAYPYNKAKFLEILAEYNCDEIEGFVEHFKSTTIEDYIKVNEEAGLKVEIKDIPQIITSNRNIDYLYSQDALDFVINNSDKNEIIDVFTKAFMKGAEANDLL